jgi:hypothetical protein
MKPAVLVVLMASTVAAQQSIPVRQVGMAAALQGAYAGLKATVTGEAARMPDADYGFIPSSMPEVRTFGQLMAHIAEAQFDTCANVRGVSNPNQAKRDLKTKAEVTQWLADSFAFCDDAFSKTTDANALQFVRVQLGPRQMELTRASVLYGLLAHTSEMYGIGTVYLRAKGLVPPASERR